MAELKMTDVEKVYGGNEVNVYHCPIPPRDGSA